MSTITTTLSPIPLLKHRSTVVTLADQDEFVTKYEATNDHLSNNTVVEVNDICNEMNSVASEINVSVITTTTKANEASTSATSASDSATVSTDASMVATTKADEANVSANTATTKATEASTSATESQLSAWESEAQKKTAYSFADEAEDVFVKIYISNGDGTFSYTSTNLYSSSHWSLKSADIASGGLIDDTQISSVTVWSSYKIGAEMKSVKSNAVAIALVFA
jgi:hypothetical protein